MSNELKVFSNDGKTTTDWWFMYKFPKGVDPKKGADKDFKSSTGKEYIYFQPKTVNESSKRQKTNEDVHYSQKPIDDDTNCLNKTLSQLYDADKSSASSLGWICYNDEVPTKKSNNGDCGHTKGVLAFDLDSDTAFWLLHSWPKFPNIEKPSMASLDYSQTFICIQLKDVDTARSIATQMFHQNEPQTYQVQLPKSIKKTDMFYKLANSVDVNDTDPPTDINFLSKGKNHFRFIAKNRHWGKDFWIDLVGPHLKSNILVETWRRGTLPDTEESDKKHEVTDILYIDFEKMGVPYEWKYTKDHSKWGISNSKFWVCIADINRQTSQEKRGGGTICFQNKHLWKHLKEIEKIKA